MVVDHLLGAGAQVRVLSPGRTACAYRLGGHLAPQAAAGTISFDSYLQEMSQTGEHPYGDVIRDLFRPCRTRAQRSG